jgi:hypothetical protein
VTIDIHLIHHGSIIMLPPLTPAARGWVQDHLPEDAMRFGRGIAVEPRYIDDIADGAEADGLICAWTLQ